MTAVTRTLTTQAAAVAGVALVTLGLYAWSSAAAWALSADRVEAAAWCVRLAAVAALAAGQVLFAGAVVPGVFGTRGTLERRYALISGVVAGLATTGAAVLTVLAGW